MGPGGLPREYTFEDRLPLDLISESLSSQQFSRRGRALMSPSPIHEGLLTVPVLNRLSVGNQSWEFIIEMVL